MKTCVPLVSIRFAVPYCIIAAAVFSSNTLSASFMFYLSKLMEKLFGRLHLEQVSAHCFFATLFLASHNIPLIIPGHKNK